MKNNNLPPLCMFLLVLIISMKQGFDVCFAQQAPPPSSSATPSNYTALFVYGDSLADVGNNNYILTLAKANLLPNGIDYPSGPTGRFCNGEIVVDYLAKNISLPSPPPYLAPTTRGQALLKGVNYASGAAGILASSGYNFVGRIALDTQLAWFRNTIQQIQQLTNASATLDLIQKAVYCVIIGSNDYINNYLLPFSNTSLQYTPQQYQQVLLEKLSSQLKELYKLGARMVIVPSIGPLGCIPSQLAQRSANGSCSSDVNNLILGFNQGLQGLLTQLNVELPGANFIFVDVYHLILDILTNLQQYGFKSGNTACCGFGRFNGDVPCVPILVPCANRSDHVFWDPFHPTQATNIILGNVLLSTFSNATQ